MRIVGVIDLRRGEAVHARGGQRDRYEPVARAGGVAVDGNPETLVRAYIGAAVRELYVADLDAIAGAPLQSAAIARLAAAGLPVMVDAGVSSADAAAGASVLAERVVVGLETLVSWAALAEIAGTIGPARTVFSLDLRDGTPLGHLVPAVGSSVPATAARAVASGAGSVLVIDVAHVGMATGPDVMLLRSIRHAIPDVPFLAGGGVRGAADLALLAACGCDGALVATAIHDGRVTGRSTCKVSSEK